MKTSLPLNRSYPIKLNFASLIAFFAKLVARLPRRKSPPDDPAALRYIFSKYNNEGD